MTYRSLLIWAVLTFFITSCNRKANIVPGPDNTTPIVGELYQGGYVFYLDNTGKHGLLAAAANLKLAAQWGCEGVYDTATGTGLGSGQRNTAAILKKCTTEGIAARMCDSFTLNSYPGWFLPSRDELNLMYTTLYLNGKGGFYSNFYWSSTEADETNAWFQYFGTGYQDKYGKSHEFYVRPVRAF